MSACYAPAIRDVKNIEETTWGEISWAALRGFLIVAVVAAPVIWLCLENQDAIRTFIVGLAKHLPDAR